jgi:transposase-like protein
MAFGVDGSGHRTVLGVSVSLSEAEVHWRDFFAHLHGRGLSGVRLLISDDHAGMKAAREARFPGVPWQRCQFHMQQNAGHYVPRVEMRREVAGDLRAIFESESAFIKIRDIITNDHVNGGAANSPFSSTFHPATLRWRTRTELFEDTVE